MSALVDDLRAELRVARATRQELLAQLAAAEQERDRAEERSRLHAAQANDLGAQLGAANARAVAAEMQADAALSQAEELTRALRVAQSDLARALADGRVELRQRADDAERVAADLRAIIEGRTTPPTDDESRAHASEGGWWLALVVEDARPDRDAIPHVAVHGRVAPGWRGLRWLALDANGRPCPWPTTEAPRG